MKCNKIRSSVSCHFVPFRVIILSSESQCFTAALFSLQNIKDKRKIYLIRGQNLGRSAGVSRGMDNVQSLTLFYSVPMYSDLKGAVYMYNCTVSPVSHIYYQPTDQELWTGRQCLVCQMGNKYYAERNKGFEKPPK